MKASLPLLASMVYGVTPWGRFTFSDRRRLSSLSSTWKNQKQSLEMQTPALEVAVEARLLLRAQGLQGPRVAEADVGSLCRAGDEPDPLGT